MKNLFHQHQDNQPSQAEFVCQRFGLTDNADQNASRIIAQRGIRLLLEGTTQKKEVRRCWGGNALKTSCSFRMAGL